MKKYLSLLSASALLLSLVLPINVSAGETESELPPVAKYRGENWEEKSFSKHKDEEITLDWFVAFDWASHNFDPENNLFDKDLLANTGIKINWSMGDTEKLNTLMATNNLPDIITYTANSPERRAMERSGQLLPLEELRDKYAPDYQPPKGMEDWYRADDGHWYIHVSYFYDLNEMAKRKGYLVSHNMIFARKDLMEQIGVKEEDFRTQDGVVEALKKAKEANLEYNGLPVRPWLGINVIALAEQFGLDRQDKDGNLLNTWKQDEYLEALLFLNRLYREGLLDDEEFTMDSVQRRQICSSGQVFAGFDHPYLQGKESLFTSDPKALMGGVGLIRGKGDKEPILTPSPTGGWTATMISKNCKDPERAIQLFSYLTQADMSLTRGSGLGWKGYEIKDDKIYPLKERTEELAKDPEVVNLKYNSGATDYFADWVDVQQFENRDDASLFDKDCYDYTEEWQEGHMYDDKLFSSLDLGTGTEEAIADKTISDDLTLRTTDIIRAGSEEEAIELYKAAIENAESLGLSKIDEKKNELFQKNKEKMNVKEAWPRWVENWEKNLKHTHYLNGNK